MTVPINNGGVLSAESESKQAIAAALSRCRDVLNTANELATLCRNAFVGVARGSERLTPAAALLIAQDIETVQLQLLKQLDDLTTLRAASTPPRMM